MTGWYPDTPTFMLGHSMGGLIAAHLLLQDAQSYRGAMLSAPAFCRRRGSVTRNALAGPADARRIAQNGHDEFRGGSDQS